MQGTQSPQEIIQAIVDSGVNPTEIARRTNISQPTISRILSGNHKDPRNSTVNALRELLTKIQASRVASRRPRKAPQRGAAA